MQHQQKTTTIQVPPSRLAMGEWCHQSNTSIGEGDIYGAYSADKIALEGKIRKPFRLKGWLYTATSVAGTVDSMKATAYRLMQPSHVGLQPKTQRRTRIFDLTQIVKMGFTMVYLWSMAESNTSWSVLQSKFVKAMNRSRFKLRSFNLNGKGTCK